MHNTRRNRRHPQPCPKRPQPRPEDFITSTPGPAVRRTRPFRGQPASDHLGREIEEDGDCHVFFREALFEEFERGDGFVYLETDLAD